MCGGPACLPGIDAPVDPDAAARRQTAAERQAEWEMVDRVIAARKAGGLSAPRDRNRVRSVLRGIDAPSPEALEAAAGQAAAMTIASVELALNGPRSKAKARRFDGTRGGDPKWAAAKAATAGQGTPRQARAAGS